MIAAGRLCQLRRHAALAALFCVLSALPLAASAPAATVDECRGMGDELLASTEHNQTMGIINRILDQCDTAALLSIAEHFNQIGRTNAAAAIATACTQKNFFAFNCWIAKASLHVELLQLNEAETAAGIALTLAGSDPARQELARRTADLVADAKRASGLFGR